MANENHSIRMSDELWEYCQKAGAAHGMSASDWVRLAIIEKRNREESPERQSER